MYCGRSGSGSILLPELPDVNAQILRVDAGGPKAPCSRNLWVSTLPACCTKQPQQLVLLRRKLHLLAAHLDDAAHEVDRQIAELEDRPLALHLRADGAAPRGCGPAARPCRRAWSRSRRRPGRAPRPCQPRRRGWTARRSGTSRFAARIWRSSSSPCMSGRPRSRMTRSGLSARSSSAALPFAASRTW